MITRVGVATNDEGFAAAASDSATRYVERGESILVGITWGDPSSRLLTSVTCSGEQDLMLVGSPYVDGTLGQATQYAYLAKVMAAGTKTITINFDGVATGDWWVQSYSSADPFAFYDAGSLATASGVGVGPTVNVVPTRDNALLVGYSATTIGGYVVGSGYTLLANGSGFNVCSSEDDVDGGAAGSRAVDFTATSAAWMIAAAAFKPAEPTSGIVRSNSFGLF